MSIYVCPLSQHHVGYFHCLEYHLYTSCSSSFYLQLLATTDFFTVSAALAFLECHMEKAMAPHSSTLAWKIPWMEEPGGLLSMGSLRVGHDWATSLTFHFHALEKEMATHSSVLAWRIPGTGGPGGLYGVYGVTQSQTRLKRLSSSSSNHLFHASASFLFSL